MPDDNNDRPTRSQARSRTLISENLKRVFEEDANEEIPQHLKDFIAQLEASDAEGTPKDE